MKAAESRPWRPFHPGYVSEFEQFMRGYLDQHPAAVAEQRRGWYLWWERRQDVDARERALRDAVPTRPYYYR
ncbi:DUF3460 family protein [Massilia sp. NR 4-1]|uniref:DUF3460 family protein n=1 Tax=Massilia sp. NR 4-1 TaxID=1678028 RepID=UPI00067A78EB|nr:DUF3460 family protein [Massilia sp. NR 4-1]AKU20619.1 hypothetical protein ACZ75_02915 [Massilia sp. NR 4-1]